jgi:hypothetical protein
MQEMDRELVLDANAAAGILREVFGTEMTAAPTECAHCGNKGAVGSLLAYMQGPGIILRCSACEGVMLRIVQTPESTILDARGAVYLRLDRTSA